MWYAMTYIPTFLLSLVFLRFVHVDMLYIHFTLSNVCVIFQCMWHQYHLFSHSHIGVHLGYFQILAGVSHSMLYTLAALFVHIYKIFFRLYTRSRIAGSVCFLFYRILVNCSPNISHIFTSLPILESARVLKFCILVNLKYNLIIDFICVPLIINEIHNCFYCSLPIWISSVVICLNTITAHFPI